MITFKSCRYSVPTKFINTHLAIRIIDNQIHIYDNTDFIRCHEITNNFLNYNKEDKLEILKSDLLYGKTEKEIIDIINNSDLSIYDDLKEGVVLE
jgi:hypothetical protein